ncbi:MAG TPA: transcriptional regulator [Candidatus Acidoferrum sp.]|nr:transcriptional regulator [Candidatus Acidoferrum sp.]
MPTRSSNLLSFGPFGVDFRAGELYKSGRKIRLQAQPFDVLAVLLERPGEVVTREELQKRLWPADTFVDFEHSVNTAIKKLRQALGDDKSKPRYVETLPKRGYRFIAEVTGRDANEEKKSGEISLVGPGKSPWIGKVAKLSNRKQPSFSLVAVDEATVAERQKLDGANDDVGLSLLIAAQKLLMVPEGTPLRVLEVEPTNARCQARILEGEHYGKTAMFPLEMLADSPELDFARKPRQWNLAR